MLFHRLFSCVGMVCALRAVNRLWGRGRRRYYRWGLSFQSEGAPPFANASQRVFRNFDALYVGDVEPKDLHLRLMPEAKTATRKNSGRAQKHGVRQHSSSSAIDFEAQPELVKRGCEGHTIGNHTYSHPDMSKIA